MMTFSILF